MMGYGGYLSTLLVVVILWAIIQYIYKNRSNTRDMPSRLEQSAGNENAMDILKKRFASGEISQQEYERMEKEL
jgi:uncharacterized membrane protein